VITAVVNTYYVVKAIHSMTVMVTFGGAFVYPLAFAVASRHDPRSLPALHRIEYTLERLLIIPGLLVVILTGIDITSISHHWGMFFVQWGLSATIAIGALVSAVMIPGAERAAALAERDVTASAQEEAVGFSEEYRALARRLLIVGMLLSALVLITTLFMAVAFNP
jgi:uncharacterized membrane protein